MPERRPDWVPVARWEMYRILRRKDFILSILITPLLVFAFGFLMTLFEHKGDRTIAVARADRSGAVTARGAAALPPRSGFTWADPGDAGADTAALAGAVREREFEAAIVLRETTEGRVLDLVTRREPPRWTGILRAHVDSVARAEKAAAFGLSAAQVADLERPLPLRSHVASGPAGGSRRADFIVTFAMLMLMATVILTSMSYLMVGIGSEKQARVTEVVVSAIPAQSWMDGKIVAFTGVGLITAVVWAASLLVVTGPLALELPGSVHPGTLSLSALFAVLGLYFYNAMIAALMASAQNLQSASKWQGNFIMLPMLPFFFLVGLIENPDSLPMMLLSWVPFFSPVMLPTRIVQGAVAPWEIVLALVLLAASCWLMRLVAGRVFRIGMLMYGKDMSLPELIRWARVK